MGAGSREKAESEGPQDPSSGRYGPSQSWEQCLGLRVTGRTTPNLPKPGGPQFRTDYLPSTCSAHAQPARAHRKCQASAPPCMAHAATQPTCLASLPEKPPPVPT